MLNAPEAPHMLGSVLCRLRPGGKKAFGFAFQDQAAVDREGGSTRLLGPLLALHQVPIGAPEPFDF